MRNPLPYERSYHLHDLLLLAALLGLYGGANYLYARTSGTEYLMKSLTIHDTDYNSVYGYRLLTGPPYHLPDKIFDGLDKHLVFKSMGVGVEGGHRPFSWARAKELFLEWHHGKIEDNPFLLVPVALLCSMFGPSPAVVVFAPTLYLFLLLICTYLIAKEMNGSESGFFAALVVGLIPWVIGLSRFQRSYICLIAFCALSFFLLLKTRHFTRPLFAGLLLISLYCGYYAVPADTEAVLFLITMAGPMICHALLGLSQRTGRFRVVLVLLTTCAVLGVFEWDWNLFDHVTAKVGDALVTNPRGDVFFNIEALWAYPVHLVTIQLTLFVSLLLAGPMGKFCQRYMTTRTWAQRIDLVVMFVAPLLLLTYLHKKQPIYATQLCLPIALAAGVGLGLMKDRGFKAVLVLVACLSALWRGVPLDNVPALAPIFESTAVRAIDALLWRDACDQSRSRAFCYDIPVCFPTQYVQPVDGGAWKKDPVSFFKKLSEEDGLQVGIMYCHDDDPQGSQIRKGAALLALNQTITVELFNGMPSFDLPVEAFDWIVLRLCENDAIGPWLKAGEEQDLLAAWGVLDAMWLFPGEEQSIGNLWRFMMDLESKASLQFLMLESDGVIRVYSTGSESVRIESL